jgi:acylphosphatase
MGIERHQVVFGGRVQGVGFRYTACRLARRYDVTGYVRNLVDGRVEMAVEGDGADIEALVRDIRDAMRTYLKNVQSTVLPATGEFQGFTVRH